MKSVVRQWVEYNKETGHCSKHPWYLASGMCGGKLVGRNSLCEGGVPSYLGIAYYVEKMDAAIMYPKPLHLIVRLYHSCYWKFLRFFYRQGLIDTRESEEFRWSDFFRIRVQ